MFLDENIRRKASGFIGHDAVAKIFVKSKKSKQS